MMKSYSLVVAFFVSFAAGKPHTCASETADAATLAPSAAAQIDGITHLVTVGGVMPSTMQGETPAPLLVFSPDHVFANVGDTVRFNFMQKNHSVAQSTFDEPCLVKAGGVQSGFMPNPDGTIPAPVFDFKVEDTAPIWMFCQQAGHCGKGMVFAVNPANDTGKSTDKSMKNYKQIAVSKFGALTASATTGYGGEEQNPAPTAVGAAAPTGAAASASTVVAKGNGTSSDGQTCACQCLCAANGFPVGAGVGQFGGFLGEMPAAPSAAQNAGAAAASGTVPVTAAAAPPVRRSALAAPLLVRHLRDIVS